MSKIKLAWSAFCGFINPCKSIGESVCDYALGVLKTALGSLSDATKARIQATLNTAERVLAVLQAVKWLIPTKWQTAYSATIEAVTETIDSLRDLEITTTELATVTERYNAAYLAWMSPDDETCEE